MSLLALAGISREVLLPDGSVLPILTGVDLDVGPGEHVSIVGRSGSGKSTLLNLLGLLDTPTSGTYLLDGEPTDRLRSRRRSRLRGEVFGFVFQQFNLLPVLTAYQNVELPLLLTRLSKRERDERVKLALGVVGLEDRMSHYPRQLSGGQEQRVSIARAIVADPTVILLDEPTGQLDAKSSQEVLTLLQRLNREFRKTIIIVTHDAHAAERATSVLNLEKGDLIRGSTVPSLRPSDAAAVGRSR
jgi:putative ABC transport system ATP-binding protein